MTYQPTREELELVANAMFDRWYWDDGSLIVGNAIQETYWNPITSNDDCAAMRAEFVIDTLHFQTDKYVRCCRGPVWKSENYADHPDKATAERVAAFNVALKIAKRMEEGK